MPELQFGLVYQVHALQKYIFTYWIFRVPRKLARGSPRWTGIGLCSRKQKQVDVGKQNEKDA